MSSVVERIFKHRELSPQKYCVIDEKQSYTYDEFCKLILKLNSFFEKKGVKRGDYVVVECSQDAMFLAIDMSLENIGAIFVPVEKNASEERVNEIVAETGAKLFIPADAEIDLLDETEKEYPFSDIDDIAEILYTTGTTGKSKGIVLSNKNNIAVAENIIDGTKMKKDNVELIPLPLSHSHGLRTCYANFVNGSAVVIVDGVMRVKKWISFLKEYKVTSLDLSPVAARALIKVTRGRMEEFAAILDYVEIGTAALDEDIKQSLCEMLPNSRLYNFYGSTEAGRVCALDFNSEKGLTNCIGYPTKNATFIITDEDRNPIDSDKDNMGLLAILGEMNMVEYYKSPELTRETLKNGYILTNDIGYIDEQNRVFMIGRQGSVINYMGIKISPEEIESVVLTCEKIADCACVPAKDQNGIEVPKLFVVTKGDIDKQEIREFLKQKLESNKMPQIVEIIDTIPRASNGKILRNQLIK